MNVNIKNYTFNNVNKTICMKAYEYTHFARVLITQTKSFPQYVYPKRHRISYIIVRVHYHLQRKLFNNYLLVFRR